MDNAVATGKYIECYSSSRVAWREIMVLLVGGSYTVFVK